MNGFARVYFSAIGTVAFLIARRRKDASERWTDRAVRWKAKAATGVRV